MSTARHIITRAFSKAGIRPAESPLTASEIEDGRDVLNDMLSAWSATGTLTGVQLIDDVDAETLIPREAEWAVKANLAILIAGEYGVEISQAMARDATQSMSEWIKASVNLLEVEKPATLPMGSGNYSYWNFDRDFFPTAESGKENF